MRGKLKCVFCLFLLSALALPAAQSAESGRSIETGGHQEHLQYAIYLSRHGVRSPTKPPAAYNAYSAAPWPQWSVPPGYLTTHGYALMKLFGAYDRAKLASEGLLSQSGCRDAGHVTILADSDERTRETGNAIAQGMFPGCRVKVEAQPEGKPDPLFHALRTGVSESDKALAVSAVEGQIGGDPQNLTEAYRRQLEALDGILAGCGRSTQRESHRTSLFDIPSSIKPGKGDHPLQLRGPLSTASSLSENLLLEYTEGLTGQALGWGCLDAANLRAVMELHTAASEIEQRVPVIATLYASNLLDHISKSLEQAKTGKPVAGALGMPDDRLLLLAGHDTNIAAVAGVLGLHWIIDGRMDDTPPGGALIFELWKTTEGTYRVRLFYTAQTLDQMRKASALTLTNPPLEVPLFVPGCSGPDMSCSLHDFAETVSREVDSRLVSSGK